MKLYQVWDDRDAAASDAWYPTIKAARAGMEESYGFPAPEYVQMKVHEIKGPLTKARVCSLLTHLPQR